MLSWNLLLPARCMWTAWSKLWKETPESSERKELCRQNGIYRSICVLTAGSDVPNNNLSLAPGTLDPRRPQTNVASLWCFASFASNACRYRARSHLHVHHAVCSAIYLIGFELWLLGWTFGNNVKLFQAWWLVLAANTRPEDARTTCACMQITTISCFRAKLQRHSNHLEGLEKFLMMGFPVDRINIGDLSESPPSMLLRLTANKHPILKARPWGNWPVMPCMCAALLQPCAASSRLGSGKLFQISCLQTQLAASAQKPNGWATSGLAWSVYWQPAM